MVDKIPLHEVVSVTRGDGELLRMFQELDVDGSGTLSRAEFEQVLACVLRIYVCTCVCCYEASPPPCLCPVYALHVYVYVCVCMCVCCYEASPGPASASAPCIHPACVCVCVCV